jgi:microsomal epoxide hydrolase
MAAAAEHRPFAVHVPDGVLQDLRERLAKTRWPDEIPGSGWIVEKFQRWTDCDGDVERAVSRDDILTDVTIYWVTGSINASFWPYYDRVHRGWPFPDGKIDAPTGYAEFPREILRPPRAWAERAFDIRRWTRMPRGGHFAALEAADLLAEEIGAFFRPLRRP